MDTTSSERGLALIGAGYWGKNLARNFHALGVLRTICDDHPATLANYSTGYDGVEKLLHYETILENKEITKVVIAAPAVMHFQLAKMALMAGKDVLVEKPLSLDPDEGRELLALSEQTNSVLMVGHLLQYHPCIQALQALIANGDLGRLFYITSARLNLGKIRREENALWSFAPHDISVVLSLIGHQLPVQIHCTGEFYLSEQVADTTLTHLKFRDNVSAHIHVSWLNPIKEQKLTVVGSEGMAVFDDTLPWAQKLALFRHYLTWKDGQVPTPNKRAGESVLVPESEPLRNECQHFLDCCRKRSRPRTDAAEGLRVLRVLQAAQESLNNQGATVLFDLTGAQSLRAETAKQPMSAVKRMQATDFFVHSTAVVDDGASIGKGTKVWHFSHIMKDAIIGERCIFGQNVNVDGGTLIGNNVKVQNNVSIYAGLVIEDDVFLGPSCVFTNVTNPRSQVNRHQLYEKTIIKRGATIGANATILCGLTIGRYAFIGAGAVVTKNVPDYGLVVGNPARQQGWMSRHGHPLIPGPDGIMICPESGFRYRLEPASDEAVSGSPGAASGISGHTLRCLDLSEAAPLPPEQAKGVKSYDEFRKVSR
jgi:UDP-2-acetamido-3-amino-2,3-dideoxy-glucuronate N-acetyltransferase